MALDINGYSNVFKTFVDFAQRRVDANDEYAIADAHVGKILANPDNLNERGLEDINYLLSEIRKDIGDKSGRSENRLGNEIMIEAENLP